MSPTNEFQPAPPAACPVASPFAVDLAASCPPSVCTAWREAAPRPLHHRPPPQWCRTSPEGGASTGRGARQGLTGGDMHPAHQAVPGTGLGCTASSNSIPPPCTTAHQRNSAGGTLTEGRAARGTRLGLTGSDIFTWYLRSTPASAWSKGSVRR